MVVLNPAGMKMALGENPRRVYGDQKRLPSTRMGNAAALRTALVEAQNYLEQWRRYEEEAASYKKKQEAGESKAEAKAEPPKPRSAI